MYSPTGDQHWWLLVPVGTNGHQAIEVYDTDRYQR